MKKLFVYMKGYRTECVLAPLFKLIEALLELFVPILVADIIDLGIGAGDRSFIIRYSIYVALLGLLGLLFSVTAQYFSAKAAIGFASRLRLAAFSRVQDFSYSQIDAFGTPSIITRITGDIDRVQSGVNMTLRLFLRSPFVVFGSVIAAFLIDTKSALVFAGTVPLLSIIVFGIMVAGIRLFKAVQGKLDKLTKATGDNLRGARVIRAFRNEDKEVRDFSATAEALAKLQKFTGRITALLTPSTYIIINFATILLIYIGALKVDGGELSQGEVVALYNYMAKILVELIKLADLIITMTKAAASATRTAELITAPAEDSHETDKAMPAPVEGAPLLTMEDVSFTYHDGAEPALSHINLTVQPGSRIGIIGGTGSGKTTLVNLIPRFYEAQEGKICYHGIPLSDVPKSRLRSRIGVVPQKAVLFSGTVRENMKWGNADATEEEIRAALQNAQALDFVQEKEGALDFVISENGGNLSGGQKQRLAIARALVKKPEILILDDSSSALDYATDYRLRTALAALPENPCIFMVSQRTVSVKDCDRILVLDDGQVAGCGTHEQLLASCDIYRQIHLSQYPDEEAAMA